MNVQVTYCRARGRDVRVVATDEPTHDGQAPLHDPELVCLDIGGYCTLTRCPVCGVPGEVLAARLVRSGLHTTAHPVVRTQCAVCQHMTDYVVVDDAYATCTECGTTVEYATLLADVREGSA